MAAAMGNLVSHFSTYVDADRPVAHTNSKNSNLPTDGADAFRKTVRLNSRKVFTSLSGDARTIHTSGE